MPARTYTDVKTGEPITLVRWHIDPMPTWSVQGQKPPIGKVWVYRTKATEPDQKDVYTAFYGQLDYAIALSEEEALRLAGVRAAPG